MGMRVGTIVLAAVLGAGGGMVRAQDEGSGEARGVTAADLGVAGPLTVAESSGYARTSSCADVAAFLDGLAGLPGAPRLRRFTFGASGEGRPLEVVVARRRGGDAKEEAGDLAAEAGAVRASGRLRFLVVANIHAGEVEGKEVAQILLREVASGAHEALLHAVDLLVVPVYNPDGNEAVSRANRVEQNGPEAGVGRRENAAGLDLNRDMIKAQTPECRALLDLLAAFDPHVLVDLHTTNGSPHAYHLTYATSLATAVDPELAAFAADRVLPELRRAVHDRWLYRTFEYGNFAGEDGWVTFDHRPRFLTNYFGLRNRLALLSEAYSCCDFETRVRVTRAFVLEALGFAARNADALVALCRAADARAEAGEATFGWDTVLAPAEPGVVLTAEIARRAVEGGERHELTPGMKPEVMGLRTRFSARRHAPLPAAWAIAEPTPEVLDLLRRHGLVTRRLAAAEDREVERFRVAAVTRAERPFQGRHAVTLEGAFERARVTLPAGALVVPRQALARLAAQLLEPLSEDSLTTWGLLDPEGPDGAHPVLRLVAD